jgi:hypothetical protein
MCFSIAAARLGAALMFSLASIVRVLMRAFELKVRSANSDAYSATNSLTSLSLAEPIAVNWLKAGGWRGEPDM